MVTQDVEIAYEAGLIQETTTKTTFDPQKSATRETVAAALHQLLRGIKFVESIWASSSLNYWKIGNYHCNYQSVPYVL